MLLPTDDLQIWCTHLVRNPLFLQLAPFAILFLVPATALLLATRTNTSALSYFFFHKLPMGLESLGFNINIPWLWTGSGASNRPSSPYASSSGSSRKKSTKHGGVRTRAEQLALNGSAKNDVAGSNDDDGYYPGLVNISGTYCFMNSTIQALASLSYLQPHIDAIHAKAELLDVPTPVIDALQDLFHRLNTPRKSYHSIRPTELIEVLTSQTEGRTNSLFYSREHQDAQELFQVLSECMKNEIAAVDKEGYRDRGLGALAQVSSPEEEETMREIGKSVFDGLTANRRSCVICGYTEAVMHFALDSWQLAVPRLAASCRLEDCLEDYTRLEILKDCICRKCSILATHRRLQQEIKTLEEAIRPDAKPSSSKKRRLKEVKKMEARVKAALDEGRIEDDLKDVRMEKVFSPASTKQAMIARSPCVLALHVNRSVHYGQYASKNAIRLIFPEVLDLTPYTTSGSLSTVPTAAISTPPPPAMLPRSTTPTPATYAYPRTVYRLAAVVCHYGQHSFGHYVCYRRKPKHPSVGAEKRWAPPRLLDPFKVEEDSVSVDGITRTDDGGDYLTSSQGPRYIWSDEAEMRPGKGWLRISDDSVRECGIESVLAEGTGAFMLYYEKAVQDRSTVYGAPEGSTSEETLKPEMRTVELNGSMVSEVGVGVKPVARRSMSVGRGAGRRVGLYANGIGISGSPVLGPRIVRSVAAGRGRSTSVAPSEGGESSNSSMSISLPESSAGIAAMEKRRKESEVHPLPNGITHEHEPLHQDDDDTTPFSMTASAPSLLSATSSPLKIATPSASTSSISRTSSKSRLPPRIHSPQPHHPSHPASVVDLKA